MTPSEYDLRTSPFMRADKTIFDRLYYDFGVNVGDRLPPEIGSILQEKLQFYRAIEEGIKHAKISRP